MIGTSRKNILAFLIVLAILTSLAMTRVYAHAGNSTVTLGKVDRGCATITVKDPDGIKLIEVYNKAGTKISTKSGSCTPPGITYELSYKICGLDKGSFPLTVDVTDCQPTTDSHTLDWPGFVGGFVIPIDKFSLLAPYIALAVAVVAVALGAVSARKRWLGKPVVQGP